MAQSGSRPGIAAAIEGHFAAAWFAWAMAIVVPRLPTELLQLGTGLGSLMAIVSIVLAARSPAESTPMGDRAVRRRHGILVGLEFALLGAGAAWRSAVSGGGYRCGYAPAWACISYRCPRVPGERSLVILGVLITGVALAALVTGLTSAVAPGTITGADAGLCLLAAAAITLIDKRLYTGLPPGAR